jgi:photosystem II stability/assembly factor-like uncharacterized protein
MKNRRLYIIILMIIFSQNAGYSQWFPQQTNTNCFISKIRMLNSNTGYAIGDSSLVLKTTNGGVNWQMMNTGTSHDDYFSGIHFLNADTGWVCGGYMGGFGTSKIIKTTDGGMSWNVQYSQTGTYFFSLWFVNPLLGFAGGYDGKYLRTTDGGNSWNEYVVTGADIWSMYFFNSTTGFIAGKQGMIRKTTDSGLTYTLLNSGTALRVSSIYFTDDNYGYAVCDSETVLRTTNGGVNWLSQRLGTVVGYESVFFINHNTGYAVGNWWEIATYKLIKTTNAGVNWTTVSQGNGNPYFDIFFADVNTGWITGYDGLILKTTNAGSTFISGQNNQLPSGFKLFQNYPNPFNPITKIKYSVSKNSFVIIKVYDILGKEIFTLTEKQHLPGVYELTFDASKLNSGMYIYKINADGFTDTKKMLVIK